MYFLKEATGSSLHFGLVKSRVLYHGTHTGRHDQIINAILENGLVPRKHSREDFSSSRGIYLTDSVMQAFNYADNNMIDFDNYLIAVVRVDVSHPSTGLDTDAAKDLEKIGNALKNTAYSITPKAKRLLNDLTTFTNLLQQSATGFLRKWLTTFEIVTYPKALYSDAFNYIYTYLALSVASFIAEDEESTSCKFLAEFAYPWLEKTYDFLKETQVRKFSRDLDLITIRFTEDYVELSKKLRIFLLAFKFKSSVDRTPGYTLRVDQPIGFLGPLRIIGLVAFSEYDEEANLFGRIYYGRDVLAVQNMVKTVVDKQGPVLQLPRKSFTIESNGDLVVSPGGNSG